MSGSPEGCRIEAAACADRRAPDGSWPGDSPRRILVIGYGNPGRRDDGLGPALAARLAALDLPGVTVESDYQLAIEHAELAARHEIVVFADAASDVDAAAAFYLRPVLPAPDASCFSHHVSPQAVLQLAAECFNARAHGWLLGIRPLDLESFAEGLTPAAEGNLAAAVNALRQRLEFWRHGFDVAAGRGVLHGAGGGRDGEALQSGQSLGVSPPQPKARYTQIMG